MKTAVLKTACTETQAPRQLYVMTSLPEIRFDEWRLRSDPLELWRGEERVRLQEQPLRVLQALLTSPGQLVTREQLIARLWPKRVVDFDTALNAAVRRLRAALNDEAETPKYIETVPRHGYRFIGVLRVEPPDAPPQPAAPPAPADQRRAARIFVRRWSIAAALVLLLGAAGWGAWVFRSSSTPAAARSIVVMPFADLSPKRDQEFFADGLTEELLNSLAQSQDLRVIARTSSFSFKGKNIDVETIARQLDVTHVLEGSVRKSGDRLRITAQLIDARNSLHVWSQTYDRRVQDVLEVQTEIATAVADALRVALSPRRANRTAPEAYEHYLRAHYFFHRRARGDVELARDYYQKALDIDPAFAPAWAGLAGAYRIAAFEGALEPEQALQRSRAAAERAIALDPDLAEGHLRLSRYYFAVGEHDKAMPHVRRAQALAPNHPLLLGQRAGHAAQRGEWDEAIGLQRRTVAADPLSFVNQLNLADMLLFAGRLQEARVEAARARELDPQRIVTTEAHILILERRFDEAVELARTWPDGVDRAHVLALAYFGQGRTDQADTELARLISAHGAEEPASVAEVYAWRGETEAAFQWVEAMNGVPLQRRNLTAYQSPYLKPLRGDARWAPLLQASVRPASPGHSQNL